MSKLKSVIADSKTGVKIGKVFGGYFSNEKNISDFIEKGIKLFLPELSNNEIVFADFGGGEGKLTNGVKLFLEKNGKQIEATVIDGNEGFLKIASDLGLKTVLSDLTEYSEPNKYDFIIQRAMLHYNQDKEKNLILENIFSSLKQKGFFASQISTGSKSNCDLRNRLVVNEYLLPIGTRGANWITTSEYISKLEDIGFTENKIVGYADSGSWTITKMWDRFNENFYKELVSLGDQEKLDKFEKRKKNYFEQSFSLIKEYIEKYGEEELDVEKIDNDYKINYKYPIIVSKK